MVGIQNSEMERGHESARCSVPCPWYGATAPNGDLGGGELTSSGLALWQVGHGRATAAHWEDWGKPGDVPCELPSFGWLRVSCFFESFAECGLSRAASLKLSYAVMGSGEKSLRETK